MNVNELTWRKASRSSDPDMPACVEVAQNTGKIAVRDSKEWRNGAGGGVLSFSQAEWKRFVTALRTS